uniref:Uncharacterized protein n=1 Tax=Rhizophora mucronata TaxID=61149 RepID=A0A2P2QJE2_RHIMU
MELPDCFEACFDILACTGLTYPLKEFCPNFIVF